jgi:hypothetical protein
MAIYLRGKSWYYDFVHKGQRYIGCFGQVSRTTAKEELARKKTEVIEGKLNPAKARRGVSRMGQNESQAADLYSSGCGLSTTHARLRRKTT